MEPDQTVGSRVRRPHRPVSSLSSGLQGLVFPRGGDASDSTEWQVFAPVAEESADRLRTLLSVRKVATYLAVSTKTVYALCAMGKLRHIRILNAIRVAAEDLEAFLLESRT